MLAGLLISLLGLTQFTAADLLLGLTQPHHAMARATPGRLSARQSQIPNVPAACKPDCDPVNTQVAQPCSPTDCCKASFVTGYFNCLKCVGGTLNITDYTPAQMVLDELIEACTARGFSVPKLTLPGIDPNHPLPSLSSVRPGGTAGGSSLPQSTISVTSSAPPNLPPPPLTTASSQLTITTPLGTSLTPPASQTSTTPSSARPDRFLTPHFSHLSASLIFVGFIYFMV